MHKQSGVLLVRKTYDRADPNIPIGDKKGSSGVLEKVERIPKLTTGHTCKWYRWVALVQGSGRLTLKKDALRQVASHGYEQLSMWRNRGRG